jgi:hypothetical protein
MKDITEYTKLFIDCKRHGRQLAVATLGGVILCEQCQKEYEAKK